MVQISLCRREVNFLFIYLFSCFLNFNKTKHLGNVFYTWIMVTIRKRWGGEGETDRESSRDVLSPFDKCYAFTEWALGYDQVRFNCKALIWTADTDLIVAILIYSPTHVDFGLKTAQFRFNFELKTTKS